MSTRNERGVWIVPENQAIEFLTSDIDYNKLINEALNGRAVKTKVIRKKIEIKKELEHSELFELDIDDPGFMKQERKKKFWNRDIRSFLMS